jgi:phospholipid/cholesterol/gamma-HCH transport system permease protein
VNQATTLPGRWIEQIGAMVYQVVETTGALGLFLARTADRAIRPRYELRAIAKQLHFIGARSFTVIAVAGAFTGMVVALQFYNTLVRFGSVNLLGSAVALSLIRELGPVLTALMVIGRAGSSTCAEIGIMRIDEQIDALECMAIDPYKYLMVPRLIAGVIALPLLTAIFDVIGILGGWFVGVVLFGVGEGAYFHGMYQTCNNGDILMGMVKPVVFGLIILWISTAKGFLMHLARRGAFGAEGVSRITTEAVVMSSIAILFADYLVSALLIHLT